MPVNRPWITAIAVALFGALLLGAPDALAQNTTDASVGGVDIAQAARNFISRENAPTSLTIVVLITIISIAPAILVMTTSFTRIIVVLGFLRQAMATQQTPPNQVLIGLALILTFFIMTPTYQQVNETALQPYLNQEISDTEALSAALLPMREFMFRQTRPKDIVLFLRIGKMEQPQTRDDVPTHVLMPAFILSELTTAFMIGFIIYIPFLIIDMVVASTLMAMGMMMLPPIFVSLPFKIIMFVLADGWFLLFSSLTRSFG
ncbi:MAG: flagellar type III secretion system pore protein FliP [Candidatus Hydrogenedentes bacterium]|nr:flagellar type III secretion system pore protein FliP [Candidatus Hydrogenedentota bacterium]